MMTMSPSGVHLIGRLRDAHHQMLPFGFHSQQGSAILNILLNKLLAARDAALRCGLTNTDDNTLPCTSASTNQSTACTEKQDPLPRCVFCNKDVLVDPDALTATWKIVPMSPYRKHLEEGSHIINLKHKKKKNYKNNFKKKIPH